MTRESSVLHIWCLTKPLAESISEAIRKMDRCKYSPSKPLRAKLLWGPVGNMEIIGVLK
jgi:hypothetical protein